MPVDFKIRGAEELEVIARELKRTGNGDLRKELLRGINQAVKPLKAAVPRSALANLPARGGLNRVIAGAKVSTKNRTTGRQVGVGITAALAGHDLDAIDRGTLRHPVFGNKRAWVIQQIRPGFFTEPLAEGADAVRSELLDVLERVAKEIVDGR